MDFDTVKLVDIGNTHAKIYDNQKITYIKADEFELNERFFYISVNERLNKKLKQNRFAIDIQKYIDIKTNYKGLGVDRKLLCSYINDGVIVDAGSAITIDIMKDSVHMGGYIFPGIKAMFKSCHDISEKLYVDMLDDIDIKNIPQNTQEAINFAIVKSVVLLIKDVSKDKKIYFCGGDGRFLSSYFKNSLFEEDLIFKAMKNIIKDI